MDDSKDKIRRNLVVFSAAIIVAWFLDLKLAGMAKLFLSAADVENVSAGKLWGVALAILGYLLMRYRFDDATAAQGDSLLEEIRAQRRHYLARYLQQKADQFCQTGNSSPVFGKTLVSTINNRMKTFEQNYADKVTLVRLSVRLPAEDPDGPSLYDNQNLTWTGRAGVEEEYSRPGSVPNPIRNDGQLHEYSIPLNGRIWVNVHSYLHAALYSRTAVELVMPVAFAVVAIAISVCKLVALQLT